MHSGITLISQGKKIGDISSFLGIHRQTLHRWVRESRQGQYSVGNPGPQCNRLVDEEALKCAIEAQPDARLIELADRLRRPSIHNIEGFKSARDKS